MRNHGWHLPYHPLQIVAVAVFSALAFSFYVFFVPFVGSNVLKFHIIAVFSPMVFAVFTLYIRCAAIDPADSGIKVAKQRGPATRKLESSAEVLLRESERHRTPVDQLDEEASRNLQSTEAPERTGWEKVGRVCTCLCCPIATAWRCIPGTGLLRCIFLGRATDPEKYIPEEELLYCSLCEAEILKSSKHCRACDKCVDGFDHHCRWLNNCIGRKNYKTFVAVMIASVLMLITEWSIGIFVLVRCFSQKHKFDKEIVEKLGSSFTRTPFVVVVALCTFLAMLATLPLTQLLFFHLILIKKGITTYDYIVAIREQEAQDPVLEAQVGGSISSSPASSVGTGLSDGSSSGPLHRGVWCTPPRMFVENQANMKAEVMDQYSTSLRGASPRTDGESALGMTSRDVKSGVGGQPKRQIGLSAWKLARLNTRDATRASVRARESSSILRPVKYMESSVVTETEDSSFESGTETSTGNAGHKVGWRRDVPFPRDRSAVGNEHRNPLFNSSIPGDLRSGILGHHVQQKGGHPIFPLQSEARSPFRSRSLNTMGSYPYGMSATNSPDILASPDLAGGDVQTYGGANHERSWLYRATSDGYEASGGESADETSDQGRWLPHNWSKLKLNPSFINRGDAQHAPFKWPGGIDDLPARSQLDSRASSTFEMRSNGSRVEANILRHMKREWPGVRDKISTSTDGSNNSSPSHYVSSQGMSPDIPSASETHFGTHLEKSSSRESGLIFYDGPFGGGSPRPVTGKRGIPSARKLKESILSYRRGLSSSRPDGALLSSSP